MTPTRLRVSTAVAIGAGWMLLGMAAETAAHPQSLGEVARRESERRKEMAQAPGRVYSNENLAAVEPSPATHQPPSTPSTEATVATGAETAPPATGPARMAQVEDPETHKVSFRSTTTPNDNRDEAYWRGRAKEVRGKLAKASADLAASQTRLAALESGPQTPAAAQERSIVADNIKRLQSELRHRNNDVAWLQTHAEMAKVPPDWIK